MKFYVLVLALLLVTLFGGQYFSSQTIGQTSATKTFAVS
jgi:hypothetical protein